MTMPRSKRIIGAALAGVFVLGISPAWSQQTRQPPRSAGVHGTQANQDQPASQPQTQNPQNRVNNPVRVPSRTVRAPGGGVRAPGGGVRAPGGGVRAPGGGVRAPGAGQRPVTVPDQTRPDRPGVQPPGHGHPGGGCKHHHGSCRCVIIPRYGWGWWGLSRGYGWWTVPRSDQGVWGPSGREFQEEQFPEPDPPTAYEMARGWMEAGDAKAAVEWYVEHLDENPTDIAAMREYAAALLEAGRFGDAISMMGYVYDMAPGLANRPMGPSFWGDSPLRLRRSVVSAVRYAQRSPSGNAWLTVAVLMQAEGRDGVALRMVDRAADEGLAPSVADRMRTRLSRR